MENMNNINNNYNNNYNPNYNSNEPQNDYDYNRNDNPGYVNLGSTMDCQSSSHFLQINPYLQEEINNQGPKIKYPQDVVNNQGPKVISMQVQPNSTPAVQPYNGKYNQPILIQENNRMAEYVNL